MANPVLDIDYYWEKDILYLRTLPLPPYAVWTPDLDFLVYVSQANGSVVGFEILDFSAIFPYLSDPELAPYLEMRFALPEAGLRDASLREILIWAAGRYSAQKAMAALARG